MCQTGKVSPDIFDYIYPDDLFDVNDRLVQINDGLEIEEEGGEG